MCRVLSQNFCMSHISQCALTQAAQLEQLQAEQRGCMPGATAERAGKLEFGASQYDPAYQPWSCMLGGQTQHSCTSCAQAKGTQRISLDSVCQSHEVLVDCRRDIQAAPDCAVVWR